MNALRRLWRRLWPGWYTAADAGQATDWSTDAAAFMTDDHWRVLFDLWAEAEDKKAAEHRSNARYRRMLSRALTTQWTHDPGRCQSCNDYLETGFSADPDCNQCLTLRKESE